MVGFVNNHTGDYGPQGVLDTMNAAEAHDLIACGVGRSLRESMDESCRVETYPPQDSDAFRFGSLFEGCLNIERGEKAHVRTFVNQKDADEVLKSVADASKCSDLTILMPLGWESRAIHKIRKIEDQCKTAADNSERRIPRAS